MVLPINNIQCVVDFENTPDETLKRITTGAAICNRNLVESKVLVKKFEIQVAKLEILETLMQRNSRYSLRTNQLDFLREKPLLTSYQYVWCYYELLCTIVCSTQLFSGKRFCVNNTYHNRI
jgi:aspartyl/asparaginyl-tRNA synthetase